jgi:hypothetical protein
MNARDQLKPKSIRLSILQALSDGAITTIDDLQIKMDEPRKKVATNVYPAAIEGLIKRMRDDVTGGPAYQITALGREYLAKYASGKEEEPSLPEVPVCAESQTGTAATEEFDTLETLRAERDCVRVELSRIRDIINANPEESTFDEVRRLMRRPSGEMREMLRAMQCGEMTVSRGVELLEMWLAGNYSDDQLPPVINTLGDDDSPMAVVARLSEELKTVRATLELNRRLLHQSPAPAGYVIQRPAKVLVRVTKRERAEERALCFARREGKRARVFALIPVGESVPGAEWKEL